MQQLFRKKDDRSSEFSADNSVVRRDGTYIYEEFVPTGGTDVKVCLIDCLFVVSPMFAYLRFTLSVKCMHMLKPENRQHSTEKCFVMLTGRLYSVTII